MDNNDDLESKIGIDDEFVYFVRKVSFEKMASNENSDLYCIDCETNLPYDSMTTVQPTYYEEIQVDWKQQYYCPLCEKTFYSN